MRRLILFCILFIFCVRSGSANDTTRLVLSMDQLIDHAVENNYLLKAHGKKQAITSSAIDLLKTDYLPRISLNASASYWKFLMPNKQRLLGNTLSDVYTDITVNQTIYSWGEQDLRTEMIHSELKIEEEVERQIVSAIIWSVSDAFFESIKAESEVKGHQSALEQLQSHLKYAENLYKVGRVSNIDLLRIQVQISVAENVLQKAMNEHRAEIIQLKRLTYIDDDTDLAIINHTDSLFHLKKDIVFSPSEIYNQAIQKHPALKSAEMEITMEARQKELYRIENRPELFSYGIASWNDGYFPFGDNFNYNIGVGLRYIIPYWGGSAYRVKMTQSDLRIDQISEERSQQFQEIKREIDLAVNELDYRLRDTANNEKIIILAGEALSNALVKYQSGLGNIVDVLDAQVVLTDASINYRTSIAAYLQAISRLHYLAGHDNKPF